MRPHILHTPEAQAQWDACLLQRKTLDAELRKIDNELVALAAQTFAHLMRCGKWKITDYNQIVPVDHAAKEQVLKIISTACKLKLHDTFTVSNLNKTVIYGQVYEGDLTLNLFPSRVREALDPDDAAATFDELQVDIDLTEWTANLRAQALLQAQRELAQAQLRVKTLQEATPRTFPKESD